MAPAIKKLGRLPAMTRLLFLPTNISEGVFHLACQPAVPNSATINAIAAAGVLSPVVNGLT
jgi:hypothetical protein